MLVLPQSHYALLGRFSLVVHLCFGATAGGGAALAVFAVVLMQLLQSSARGVLLLTSRWSRSVPPVPHRRCALTAPAMLVHFSACNQGNYS